MIYVKNDYDARIIKSAGCWYLLFCAVPKGVLIENDERSRTRNQGILRLFTFLASLTAGQVRVRVYARIVQRRVLMTNLARNR